MEVRRVLKSLRGDVIIVHDIELLPVVVPQRNVSVVWDVHEDYSGAITDRKYIPRSLHFLLSLLVQWLENYASRNCHILLAEESYRNRFPLAPVVRNTPIIPFTTPPDVSYPPSVVYVGRVSESWGLLELIDLGRRACGKYQVEMIGAVDSNDADRLAAAVTAGEVVWHGFRPNDNAKQMIAGATVGLSPCMQFQILSILYRRKYWIMEHVVFRRLRRAFPPQFL